MKFTKILSKFACGAIVASLACTVVANAALGDLVAEFNKNALVTASGEKTLSDDGGYRSLVPDTKNTANHSIYGLEKDGLDGKQSYTFVVNVRFDGYAKDALGKEATEDKAKVFGIDPKYRDSATGGDIENAQDPIDCWFTVKQIKDAFADVAEGEFVPFFCTVNPKQGYYEGVDLIKIENRIAFRASADDTFMKLAIDSMQIYEGDYEVPGGVKGTVVTPTDEEEEDEELTSSKAGGSIYKQGAKYKGSNKDFVNGNYNNASYDETYDAGNVVSGTTVDVDGDSTTGNTDTETTETNPQSGRNGMGMLVLAMGGAAVLGGTAIVLGKKRSKNSK